MILLHLYALLFIYLFILSYDMFYMGCLCIVILSLTDQIMEQDKKIRDLKDV